MQQGQIKDRIGRCMFKKLHIVYATDSRYLFPTKVAASSAVAWASRKEDLVIDILDCGLGDDEWNSFSSSILLRLGDDYSLVRHKINMAVYDNMQAWHTSKGAYARLELPQILGDVDWCIYADGDTLFTDDPFKLMEFFDESYALLGHRDAPGANQAEWHARHGLPWVEQSRVCSGFLVMNLTWFRENRGVEKLFEFLKDYPDVLFPDQDALNVVCNGKIGLLPEQWGEFTFWVNRVTKPGCFHYAGRPPWVAPSRQNKIPMTSTRRIWFYTLEKICGIKPWKCEGYSWFSYYCEIIKSYFFVFVFSVLNVIPGMRGRYDGVFNDWWPHSKMHKFMIKRLSGYVRV